MTTDVEPDRVIIPVVEETVEIEKRAHRTGTVRVHRRVREETEEIDEPLETVEVVVERVPIGRWIDTPIGERQEGDTTVFPVIEEVPVVVKRFRLVEEVRVTRKRTIHHHHDRVSLRRTEIEVEREAGESPPSARTEHRRTRMTTTVIGLYQTPDPARRARGELVKNGCPEDSIQLFDSPKGDMVRSLAELGIDEEDGNAFSGAVAKGAAVIAVEVEDDRAGEICDLLERNDAHAVDAYADEEESQEARSGSEKRTLQEVEERVNVGKRRVIRGGVRARTRVSERPVEKQVNLEEEKVRVRHREADRELSPKEAERAFQEDSIEMTETAEEAQVRKAARLIGEVEISKSTTERQETVHETARKTEVDVEKIDASEHKRGKR